MLFYHSQLRLRLRAEQIFGGLEGVYSYYGNVSCKFCVKTNDLHLEKCEQSKNLGVIFDKKPNWKQHIEYVSTKISKACGSLSKLRHCLSVKVLVEIYNALIHSYVRYGIITWGNAPDSTLNPLQTLLNRAVRILTFAPFGHVDLKPIFKELYILDVKNTFFSGIE